MKKKKPSAPHCIEFLKVHDELIGQQQPIYAWMLKHGRAFAPEANLPEGIKRGPAKQCYWNSTRIVLRQRSKTPRFRYCEGYAIPKGLFPMQHGWLIDQEDRVVDVTWTDAEEYFGVIVRRTFLASELRRTRCYGIFESFRINLLLFTATELCIERNVS